MPYMSKYRLLQSMPTFARPYVEEGPPIICQNTYASFTMSQTFSLTLRMTTGSFPTGCGTYFPFSFHLCATRVSLLLVYVQ